MGKKVIFNLGIKGLNAQMEKTFDIEKDLEIFKGKDYQTSEELKELLGDKWEEWASDNLIAKLKFEKE